jgi:hypothetical protein
LYRLYILRKLGVQIVYSYPSLVCGYVERGWALSVRKPVNYTYVWRTGKSAEGIARVFYCSLVGRKIVMLHQFIKKTERTPPKELAIAIKQMKEIKNADP